MIRDSIKLFYGLSANNSPHQAERTVEQGNCHHDIDWLFVLFKEPLKGCSGEEPCKIADRSCEWKEYADQQK